MDIKTTVFICRSLHILSRYRSFFLWIYCTRLYLHSGFRFRNLSPRHYKSTLDGTSDEPRPPSLFTPSRTNMVLLSILRITLVSVLLFTSVSGHCTNPKVRKEWRCISSDERASWINAVKVLFFRSPECCQSLLNFTTQVPCKVATQSQYCSHCRPRNFVDPTHHLE
jgi:hypothetical protein